MYQKPKYTFEDVIKYMWPNHVIFPFSNNQMCLCMSLYFPSPARQYSLTGFFYKIWGQFLKKFNIDLHYKEIDIGIIKDIFSYLFENLLSSW